VRLFLAAGEPSGDRLGAALIAGLRQLGGDVELAGVGGPLMQAEGVASLFPMDELSVMGIAEVLPKYFHLKRRIRETALAAAAFEPEAVVTIDSPEFSFRVAAELRRIADTRIVHYVAPTVWAWRSGRAAKLARLVDQVLALFPFEPPDLEVVGLRGDFVGHPIATEPPPRNEDLARLRAQLGRSAPIVAALPGSRRSEVERLSATLGETLRAVGARHPGMRVLVPAVPHLRDLVVARTAEWPGAPLVLDQPEQRRAALWLADVALAKSGTVSLELAAARTPMVVVYDMNPVSRWIILRMLRTESVTLVNLVSETRAVPEFLGRDCRPEKVTPALLDLIAYPARQLPALDLTMERLGRGGEPPGLRAARALLDGLRRA
jgi:lipid-A-disaccharide synthase